MTCEEAQAALLDEREGELADTARPALRAHLDACSECRALHADLATLIDGLDAARELTDITSGGDTEFEPGTRFGDYTLERELGRGGMGVVFRARQESLKRAVALKLLNPALLRDPRTVQRFQREAQAAARLHHTNIVPVYAQGEHEGRHFYSMELVDGVSLAHLLRVSSAGERRVVDFRRAARWIAGVAEGLAHAHALGIVHRDIKPQNLILGQDDELHITDFGLARIAHEPGMTQATERIGTPAYMAPEQLEGRTIDARTDVYALGATLYELLTEQRPFQAENYEQLAYRILKSAPTAPRRVNPHVPRDLETICLRALEKEPPRRFPDAAEMARDLRRYAEDYPIASRRVGPLGRLVRWVRRRPTQASVVATLLLLAVILPTSALLLRSVGNAQIASAGNVLLDDYRDWPAALDALGFAARAAGTSDEYQIARAFADIRARPGDSVARLERLLANDEDAPLQARYLLAWAYARLARTRGSQAWAQVTRFVAEADARAERGAARTAEAWFFRGQAVWGYDPREAIRCFNYAIAQRTNFTQAMVHEARARNQLIYSYPTRDTMLEHYATAVARLEFVCDAQPRRAYPRYLLSLAHKLAGDIDAADGRAADAALKYDRALEAALSAQEVDPTSPRGYAAAAGYYESIGDYAAAIRQWNAYDQPGMRLTTSDRAERHAYQMRLHYWLDQTEQAERHRALRYSTDCGYDASRSYDPDEDIYAAWIAGAAGDGAGAAKRLAALLAQQKLTGEELLRVAAGMQALGVSLTTDVRNRIVSTSAAEYAQRPVGWSQTFVETLGRFVKGATEWSSVASAIEGSGGDPRMQAAGAHYYRAVRYLADKNSADALSHLLSAERQRDNEFYCFRAKFLRVRIAARLEVNG